MGVTVAAIVHFLRWLANVVDNVDFRRYGGPKWVGKVSMTYRPAP